MFAEGSHMPALPGIPTEKSTLESDQVTMEATLRNHRTQLIVPRIAPPVNASLVLSCAHVMLEPYITEFKQIHVFNKTCYYVLKKSKKHASSVPIIYAMNVGWTSIWLMTRLHHA